MPPDDSVITGGVTVHLQTYRSISIRVKSRIWTCISEPKFGIRSQILLQNKLNLLKNQFYSWSHLYNIGETWNFDLDGIILADFGSTRRFVDLLRWTQ